VRRMIANGNRVYAHGLSLSSCIAVE